MAADYGSSNTDRYHELVTNGYLNLPNEDWFYLWQYQLYDTTSFLYLYSHGGTYGAANTIQLYHTFSGGIGVKIAGLADTFWGGGTIDTSKEFFCYVTRRNGVLYIGGGYVGEPDSIVETAGPSISSAYTPSGNAAIARRSDTLGGGSYTYSLRGKVSDVIFVPGQALTPEAFTSLVNNPNYPKQDWYKHRVMHLYLRDAEEAVFMDECGHIEATRYSTGYGSQTQDDPRITRKIPQGFRHYKNLFLSGSSNPTFNITATGALNAVGFVKIHRTFSITGQATVNPIQYLKIHSSFNIAGTSTVSFSEAGVVPIFSISGNGSVTFEGYSKVPTTFNISGVSSDSLVGWAKVPGIFSIAGTSSANFEKKIVVPVFTITGGSVANFQGFTKVHSSFGIVGAGQFSAVPVFPEIPEYYSVNYLPRHVPTDEKQIPIFLLQEFQEIAKVLEVLTKGHVEVTFAEPDKLKEGLVRLADGYRWNPGSGKGVYVYYDGGWHKLG